MNWQKAIAIQYVLENLSLWCVQSIYQRSDNRQTWSPMPHAADGWINLRETAFLNKPAFDVSSTAAWWGLILPSCKSCALTLLTEQLSCSSHSSRDRKPLCSAEHRCTQQALVYRVPLAWAIRQLQPQTACSQPSGVNEARGSAGRHCRKISAKCGVFAEWLLAGVGF